MFSTNEIDELIERKILVKNSVKTWQKDRFMILKFEKDFIFFGLLATSMDIFHESSGALSNRVVFLMSLTTNAIAVCIVRSVFFQ